MDDKIAAIRSAMAEHQVQLVALGPGAHMHWVLDWHPHPDERLTLLAIGRDSAHFVVPSVNAEQAGANAGLPLITWRDEDGPEGALRELAQQVGTVTRLVLDETMRTDFSLPLIGTFDGAEPEFADRLVGELRQIKDDAELAALKASAAVADRAMEAGFAAIRPGLTELEVAQAMRDAFAAEGAAVAFTLCASGPNGAYPHHATGERVLEDGDAIVFDLGAKFKGYPSDMTRMAAVGRLPEGYQDVHDVVERAWQAAAAAAKPGARAHEIDDAARTVISDAGYGDYFVHRTGHGLGLEVHEPPYLTSSSQTVLEEGMVFSIEPGIYIPGRFGIRLEDIVILRADGVEVLSSLPREVRVSGAGA
ncbi:M24 family metallopeptidase [Histidinibacterium aquaticum]|uniref:M24 family metallopeptidase n=2 Tax=Histidinibacterium aquaticum TaxID=2613962 RepID=A0A5J5GMM3_9RHOB|nr:M24 family metallopeptidase [Histidinibacterium aquaticum]